MNEDTYTADLAALKGRLRSQAAEMEAMQKKARKLEEQIVFLQNDNKTLTWQLDLKQSMIVDALTERNDSAASYQQDIAKLRGKLAAAGIAEGD